MQIKIDMTLTAETAKRFEETAERLLALDLGADGKLAATVLLRIAQAHTLQSDVQPVGAEEPLEAKDEAPQTPENSVIAAPPVPSPRPRGPLITSRTPLAKRPNT